MEKADLWAAQDRLGEERQAKKRELIDRLAKLYAKNFTFDEIVFARAYHYGVIFNEAYEIARGQLERK